MKVVTLENRKFCIFSCVYLFNLFQLTTSFFIDTNFRELVVYQSV